MQNSNKDGYRLAVFVFSTSCAGVFSSLHLLNHDAFQPVRPES
jgi:hypothetical protein